MKSPLVFFLIFFFQLTAQSQKLSLSLEGLTLDMSNTGYYIEAVIDAREIKHCIGFAQKGIANKKEPVFFKHGLEQEMKLFLESNFAKNEGAEPLVLKVNHLFIYELTYQDREIASAEINVSFLKKGKNGYIELLEAGTGVDKLGMDVTKHHAKNIAAALKYCFEVYNKRKSAGNLLANEINIDGAMEYVLDNKPYKINGSPLFRKGVYHSFSDFKDNIIDASAQFEVDHKKNDKKDGGYSIIVWDKVLSVDGPSIWGFYDGVDNYIKIDRYCYKITKQGGDYMVRAPEISSGSGISNGALIGGFVGAIIGGIIQETSLKYDDYKIDFTHGRITSLEEPIYKKIESRLLLASSRYNKDDVPFTIFLDGEKHCTLQPSQYCQVSIAPEKEMVELCVESEAGKSCEQIETELFKTTIFLVSTSKKKAPKLDLPNVTIRKEISNDIKEGKFEKVCVD